MPSSSDSDDLPDVAELIASQKRPSQSPAKRKRGPASPRHSSGRQPADREDLSTSRPRKKRRTESTQVNGRARASTPVELTSDEEPQRRNPKPKSRPASAKKHSQAQPTEVIDLCSDSEDKPPLPRRPKGTQARAPPREEDVIDLISSDTEGEPGPSTRAKVPNGVHYPLPSTNTPITRPPTKRLRRQEEEEEEEEEEQPTVPRKRPRRPSDSLSPVPIVDSQQTQTPRISPRRHEVPSRPSHSPVPTEEPKRRSSSQVSRREQTPPEIEPQHILSPPPDLDQSLETKESPEYPQLPSPPQEVEERSSPEAEEPTEPLQTIYNKLFQPLPDPEPASTPCRAFSFKARFPPHPATTLDPFEPFDSDSTPPPLLTVSFFNRAIQALSKSVKSALNRPSPSNSKTLGFETSSSSAQVPLDRQDTTVESKMSEDPRVESPKASSLPAEATVGNALSLDESESSPLEPPERGETLTMIVTEAAMALDTVRAGESRLESSPSREALPSCQSSSPENPTLPALEIQGITEEAPTDPETAIAIDELTTPTPSQIQGGNQTHTPEALSIPEDQPVIEAVEVTSTEGLVPENTCATDETSQRSDIRLSSDGQSQVLVATELKVTFPDVEGAPLSPTSLSATSLPTPISPARPETIITLKTPSSPQPYGGETAPNISTITSTAPPPIQLDTSPLKVDYQDTTTVSPLDSSGRSESTNDSDIEEIADMLLPLKSPPGLTDEELLAIGLCYPDSDEG